MADGTLIFDTKVDNTGLQNGLDKTGKAGGMMGRKVSKAFVATGAAIAATGAAAIASGKKIWKMANDVAEYGDVIDKQSQQVGLSAKSYQKWDYAMKLAGTSMQDCKMGLKTLTNTLDDARNGSGEAITKFDRLGISMESLEGKSREEVFAETVKALQNVGDETERAALANDMFGKSGQNLLPLLNQQNAETEKLLEEAEKYGMVMSDKAVKASAAFEDSLTKLKGTLTGVKNRMVGEMLPGITMIMDGLSDVAVGNKKGTKEIEKGFNMLFKAIGKILPKVMQFMQKISSALIKMIPKLAPQLIKGVLSMASTVIAIIPKLIPQIVNGLVGLVGIIVQALPTLLPAIINGVTQLVVAIAESIPQYVPYFIQAAIAIVNALIKATPALMAGYATALDSGIKMVISGFKSYTKDFVAKGREFIVGLWNGFKAKVGAVANSILKSAKNLPKKVKTGLGSLAKIAGTWITSLKTAAVAKLSSVGSSIASKARAIPGKIKSALGSLYSIGRNFVAGLWNGISARWNSLVSSLKAKVRNLPAAVRKVLGIKSPSRVMMEIGEYVTEGLAIGIEKKIGAVEMAMGAVAAVPANTQIKSPLATFNGANSRAVAGAANVNTQTINQTINFNEPVTTPAETARKLKSYALYGLAGA